jgi:hypothetical protein
MKCIDHRKAVNVSKEDLAKNFFAIVAEFEEAGFLGFATVFCHVSVPNQAVECVRQKTGWKMIGTNEFFAHMDKRQVETILEKINPA